MSAPAVTSELIGADAALRRAEWLFAAMSPRNKRRYNYYLGLEAGKLARGHVKAQRGLDERPWAKRAAKPSKRVLTRIARRNRLLIYSDPDTGTVTWRKNIDGVRARIHQEGIPGKASVRTGAQMRLMKIAGGKPAGVAPATDAQRLALKRLGADTSNLHNVSWLRAGVILKYLRRKAAGTEKAPRKTQWNIPVPPRSFLGATAAERAELGRRVFRKILDDVAKGRV